MRCYYKRDGHIQAVEFLTTLKDDDRVEEARQLFEENGERHRADGFEVWDGARFIYRYPEPASGPTITVSAAVK